MPNSIDFYKRILLHFIPARIINAIAQNDPVLSSKNLYLTMRIFYCTSFEIIKANKKREILETFISARAVLF